MDLLSNAMSLGLLVAKYAFSALMNNDKKAIDRVVAIIPKEDKRHEDIRLELQKCREEAHKAIEARISGKS
jgi:hypothetical protein